MYELINHIPANVKDQVIFSLLLSPADFNEVRLQIITDRTMELLHLYDNI